MADIMSFFKPKPKGAAAKQASKPNPLVPTTFGGCASKLVAGQMSPPTVELSMGGKSPSPAPLGISLPLVVLHPKTNRGT
jgi:hypothetical protein